MNVLLNELRQSLHVVEAGRRGRLVDGAAGVLVNNLSVDLAELVDVIMHDDALRGESDLQVVLRRRADRELQGHQRAKEIVPMEAGEPGRGSQGEGSAFTEATHGMEASSQVLHLAVGEAELVDEVFQCTLSQAAKLASKKERVVADMSSPWRRCSALGCGLLSLTTSIRRTVVA